MQKLKPFDLQKALADPERVVTKEGHKVENLAHLPKATTGYSLAGVVNGRIEIFTNKGESYKGVETDGDLFLLPKTKEQWVNIYPPEAGCVGEAIFHSTEAAAKAYANFKCLACVKVEVEDES